MDDRLAQVQTGVVVLFLVNSRNRPGISHYIIHSQQLAELLGRNFILLYGGAQNKHDLPSAWIEVQDGLMGDPSA